jgi:molybdopterin biosynthesis enzyme MoaB
MDTNLQLKEYTRLLVIELVDAIADQVGTDFVLSTDLVGLTGGTHFRSRDELVEAVTKAIIGKFGARAGIRAA